MDKEAWSEHKRKLNKSICYSSFVSFILGFILGWEFIYHFIHTKIIPSTDRTKNTSNAEAHETMSVTIHQSDSNLTQSTENMALLNSQSDSNKFSSWSIWTLIALTLSFFYGFFVIYRLARPNPAAMNYIAAIAQLVALLALLGLSFEGGREIVNHLVYSSIGVKRVKLLIWSSVVFSVLAFYVGLPLGADWFNRRGSTSLDFGHYSQAVADFKLAVSLDPGNAESHFNLGNAYEEVYNYAEALTAYQTAIDLDDDFWQAYNNLGRLHLIGREDPDAALRILLAGLRQADNPFGQAVLQKNIGQVYLEKELPVEAIDILQESTLTLENIMSNGENGAIYLAEAYCISASGYEALNQTEKALQAWAACQGLAYAVRDSEDCLEPHGPLMNDCLNAQIWPIEAQQRINSLLEGE